MRRVVASSDSRSGKSKAIGRCVLALATDLLANFLADLRGDFFTDLADFFDLLEDLERVDAFAMIEFELGDLREFSVRVAHRQDRLICGLNYAAARCPLFATRYLLEATGQFCPAVFRKKRVA
jgi:hypothetical protein